MSTHPNIRSFMDLSTGHLTINTRAWLDVQGAATDNFSNWVAATPYGWFLWCDEFNEDRSIPEDLFACMSYARQHGADYILFDTDADAVEDLPYHEDDPRKEPDHVSLA